MSELIAIANDHEMGIVRQEHGRLSCTYAVLVTLQDDGGAPEATSLTAQALLDRHIKKRFRANWEWPPRRR